MRVICGSIEEFMGELAAEASADRVFRKIVRLRIERIPEQEEQVSFQVAVMASVLIGGDRPEEMLEFTGFAGRDAHREDGTRTAQSWQKQIQGLCKTHGLTLRRGKWEIA